MKSHSFDYFCYIQLTKEEKDLRKLNQGVRNEHIIIAGKIADLLFEMNCDITTRDKTNRTVLHTMIQQVNISKTYTTLCSSVKH